MADLLTTDDLVPFAKIDDDKAEQMIVDATAMAVLSAPCLSNPTLLTADQLGAAKAILRGAILRWNESGSGAVSNRAAGPFSMAIDTRQPRRAMFWPSEIAELQKVCRSASTDGGAFSIDTAADPMQFHAMLCGFAGGPCTCGVGQCSP